MILIVVLWVVWVWFLYFGLIIGWDLFVCCVGMFVDMVVLVSEVDVDDEDNELIDIIVCGIVIVVLVWLVNVV